MTIKKIFTLGLLLLFSLFINACSSDTTQQKELRISVNSWIGYAPLFYAYDDGALKDEKIKVISTVSLAESMEMFESGQSDLITLTQHEYKMLHKTMKNVVPVILLDRSNGGDAILSNRSLDELKKAKNIQVYLEIDSINSDVLEMYISKHHLDTKKMHFINKDQIQIASLPYIPDVAVVIVTYNPYNIKLTAKGYHTLASTKDITSIAVIDALATKLSTLKQNPQKFQKLKHIIDTYIDKMQNNPQEAYVHVKSFLGNISYKEYLESLDSIKWINHPSKQILDVTKQVGFETEYILP